MHERPTDTRWCSKESNAHIHRHSTTLAHTYIRTHAHTVTQTHAGYECTLSSFLVSLPVKIPSQFLCSGTPCQSLVSTLAHPSIVYRVDHSSTSSTALFTHHPTLLQCSLSIWG